MVKNRKNQSMAVRFGPLVRAMLLCLFFGGAGVGYVWQQKQIMQLSRQIGQKEERLARLREHNKVQTHILEALQSPAALDARARTLGLAIPQPQQILRLDEAGGAGKAMVQPRARPATQSQARL